MLQQNRYSVEMLHGFFFPLGAPMFLNATFSHGFDYETGKVCRAFLLV